MIFNIFDERIKFMKKYAYIKHIFSTKIQRKRVTFFPSKFFGISMRFFFQGKTIFRLVVRYRSDRIYESKWNFALVSRVQQSVVETETEMFSQNLFPSERCCLYNVRARKKCLGICELRTVKYTTGDGSATAIWHKSLNVNITYDFLFCA